MEKTVQTLMNVTLRQICACISASMRKGRLDAFAIRDMHWHRIRLIARILMNVTIKMEVVLIIVSIFKDLTGEFKKSIFCAKTALL